MAGIMKTVLVTGTDTGVGKTWISCLLIRQLVSRGLRVGAYKPVCSGAMIAADGTLSWSDVDDLRTACGTVVPRDLICPQRFVAPLAPAVAAKLEGRQVDSDQLRTGLEDWRGKADIVVVEGAGGFLCPLSDTVLVADLAEEFAAPIVIVAANRLGVVNHTLLTIQAVRQRQLDIRGIVLNDVAPADAAADPSVVSNKDLLCDWVTELPVYHCPFGGTALVPVNGAARERSIS